MVNKHTLAQRGGPIIRRTIEIPVDLNDNLVSFAAAKGLSIAKATRLAINEGLKTLRANKRAA